MRVFIGVGHGGSDSGAVGYLVEKEVNLVEALACKDFLEMHGVEVLMSRAIDENDPVTDEINECNAFEPDLAIDVHSNSGRGDGFEAFYHYKGGLSKDLAENIETEVLKIGQNSRGCKTKLNSSGKDYYAFIRETICPAVICEGFFVDNETDVQIADSLEEQKAFGTAYAKGILRTLGISIKENSSQPESDKKAKYFVQVGAYSKRENAENQLQKAKDAGFTDAFIKEI
ncbi:MAG: N-acetylmuramoyl-L-alanine amidase [Acutalibacteraceae bacterium]